MRFSRFSKQMSFLLLFPIAVTAADMEDDCSSCLGTPSVADLFSVSPKGGRVKTFWDFFGEPFVIRVSKELESAFPGFDPKNNDSHLRFVELLISGNRTREKIYGLPDSMKELQKAFNEGTEVALVWHKSPVYDYFVKHNVGLWTLVAASGYRYGAIGLDGKTAYNKHFLELLNAHPDDDFAPVLVNLWASYDEIPESEVKDPWLKAMFRVERAKAEGWKARGKGFADEVDERGWETFILKHKEAKGYAEQAAALRPDLPYAKEDLVDIAFLIDDAGDPMAYGKEAFAIQADSSAFKYFQNYFLPRWGGSEELEYKLALERVKSAPADSCASFQGVVGWVATLQRDFDYLSAQQSFPSELYEAFKEKYEKISPRGLRRIAVSTILVPEVLAGKIALIARDYDFVEKIYRENAEKFKGYEKHLSGMYERKSRIPWIAPEFYIREFAVGENRKELREAWSVLSQRGKENEARELFRKIIKDSKISLNARKVALDIYWRAWASDFNYQRAYRAAVPDSVFSSYVYYTSDKRRFSESFLEVLNLAKTIPGELELKFIIGGLHQHSLNFTILCNSKISDRQKMELIRQLKESTYDSMLYYSYLGGWIRKILLDRNAEMFLEYLGKEYEVNDRKMSILSSAVDSGAVEVVRILFERGESLRKNKSRKINERLVGCLTRKYYNKKVSEKDRAEIAEILFDNGLPVDSCDLNKTPLLELAILQNQTELVKLLILRGADKSKLSPKALKALEQSSCLKEAFNTQKND